MTRYLIAPGVGCQAENGRRPANSPEYVVTVSDILCAVGAARATLGQTNCKDSPGLIPIVPFCPFQCCFTLLKDDRLASTRTVISSGQSVYAVRVLPSRFCSCSCRPCLSCCGHRGPLNAHPRDIVKRNMYPQFHGPLTLLFPVPADGFIYGSSEMSQRRVVLIINLPVLM
jgi:hypothetical protein